jgi:hypothetical protein
MTQIRRNKMGRPIKKKFFGNLNSPDYGSVVLGSGVGGEKFSTVTVTNTGTNSLYSTSTQVTWTASAPQITGGEASTGTATVSAAGRVTALNISDAGSGYTSTSSVTITLTPATIGTAATYVISLTSGQVQNSIAAYARVPGAGSATVADIIKQEASQRYLVQTSTGTAQCKLVATNTPLEKQMYIVATDSLNSTYWVTKLTARRVVLTQRSDGGTGYEFATNSRAGWTLGAASAGIVSIASI